MSARKNPAALETQTGLVKTQREALSCEIHSTNQKSAEDFAVIYVAQKYRLTPAVARVVVILAGLGRVA